MMETIKEIKIPEQALPKLVKIKDLIYYEGPLLSHYKSEFGENYLFYWVDSDDKFNRWLVFRTSEIILEKYISKEITLLEVMSDINIGIVFKIDVDDCLTRHNLSLIEFNDLPNSYLPSNKSYYCFKAVTSDDQLEEISNSQHKGVLQAYFNNSDKIGKGTIELDVFAQSLNDFAKINLGLSRLFIIKERANFKKNVPRYSKKKEHRFDEMPYLNATKFTYFGNTSNSFGALFKTKTSANNDKIEEAYIRYLMNFFEISGDPKKVEEFFRGLDKSIIESFKNLLRTINRTKMQFNLNYINSETHFKASEYLNYESAIKILNNIDALSGIDTIDIKCSGRFTALNLNTGSYRFAIYDDENKEVGYSIGYLDNDRREMAFKIKWGQTYRIIIERKISKRIGQKNQSKRDTIISFSENGNE